MWMCVKNLKMLHYNARKSRVLNQNRNLKRNFERNWCFRHSGSVVAFVHSYSFIVLISTNCYSTKQLWLPLFHSHGLTSSNCDLLQLAGPTIRSYEDGINQKVFFLRSISRRLRSCSSALDRVRASLHSLLAPHPPLGLGKFLARVSH